ncbi:MULTISPECIES: biosynthetic-type acetolactate synthase large subunit [Intestinimonas]|uniref:biosynthetic-type acetolactate synthase large subunit n=1 Tax=Intestinimonas TaxID=1392389 RepID=UPI00067EC3B6|nr:MULTISPECIES: biosynthetic-type acetolactate synthase large subunit [Intestinimonas]MBS6282273.1 biosynthetic-type acetolactate synthase large subunit [Oscillospiraceae bacterium]MDU1325984.1 biosynthetic-type acetolactate synthase large subunit [Clostridiales bacterium]CUQ60511.1 acetolactate synthase large subunit [Flavonifractor plautii]SCJ42199.1 Acetolactate synthase large subunit [uncultured Flavonifractor sp.]BDE88577.1 acetolactate synthase [Oscillospiraceae bacterium]
MKLRATQAILECLLEQGVDTVFGYPGGTILNIYDELYRYQDKIRHILTAHEQGASHAADGYARATGKVGVCFATSGPGATNLTTGIATAHMDSSPVVFLTCNVGESTLGKDAFQEVDITGIAMPITKATYLVRDPNEIPDVIREAFAVAAMGRPGPVLIDLLKNVTSLDTMIDYEYLPKEEHQFHGRLAELRKRVGWDLNTPAPNREDVEKLVELIARSERPMLICGGGVVRSRADREFATLAQRLDAPVAITVMGGGGFPGGHALTTGMLGMHGSRASNIGCDNCDLLIAVGCRFSDRVATDPKDFAKQAKIVHIDIDRAEIDKNVRTDHHIIGDAKQVLRMVNERIPQYDHSAWKQFVFSHRPGPEADDGQLTPRQIIQTIRRMAPGDSIVCTDVGQHQMWSIQHFHFDYPGQLITSGGFGTMGFGLGAAIGAKMGHPEKTVLLMTGDGCFRMNGQELATVSHYDIPVIVVIFNNHTLGMVHQWQNLLYEGRFSQTDLNFAPDFIKLADAYGIRGRRVATSAEMSAALREALDGGHAYVIECVIDTDETVRPMVSAGKPITEFLLE